MQLVGTAFAIVAKKWFNYTVRKNIFGNKFDKLVCSEYLGKMLTLVGAYLPAGMNFETISINDCLDMNKQITTAIRMK